VLLLVNTLLSDLKSDNWVVSCSALVVACKLIGPDLVNAVYPIVVRAAPLLRSERAAESTVLQQAGRWLCTLASCC